MTYQELQDTISSYAHRANAQVGSLIPRWIGWAGKRIAQDLHTADTTRVYKMTETDRNDGPFYNQPSDFLGMKRLRTTDDLVLRPMGQNEISRFTGAGTPVGYYTVADLFEIRPTPATDTEFWLEYWAELSVLTGANDTNDVLTRNPELYVYCCLRELYTWVRDWDTYGQADGKYKQLIAELNAAEETRRYGAGVSIQTTYNPALQGPTWGSY